MSLTPEQIEFLKNLNRALKQKEKDIVEKCQHLTKEYEARLITRGGNLHEYEILLEWDYILPNGNPKYLWSTVLMNNTEGESSISENEIGNEQEWKTDLMPELGGEKWCFLMSQLYKSGIDLDIHKALSNGNIIDFAERQYTSLNGQSSDVHSKK
jgi:hypothetical protein